MKAIETSNKEVSLFVLTHNKTDTQDFEFIRFVKILEATSSQIKIDTRLPDHTLRDQFDLYLVDISHRECQDLLSAEVSALASQQNVLLFNAQANLVNEQTALLARIKGVIYQSTSAENIFKGIQRVLNGELWFCRTSISQAFNELIQQLPNIPRPTSLDVQDSELDLLTAREKSVIKLLASGAKNDDIADSLNISSHTVKTHIYSAFKKTNSRNRIELANWAQKHIPLNSVPASTQRH
ncbi:response regulator transcription factor [Pseudoalteromonas luteoviolacea]|uniref:helix-turn-helix transcriptional regulator n=1 Tax=Pseudoalteromonas luteoviolacea TaxID=43657 RepID=UPI001B372C2E|nr:response regulator transcription factor [Pseudoalteromonas luteoviolacea]MBQ4876005.1 response regulator transcription factor [Pseudoalteromonas luteoviolacea]MBQ4905640.1 response regulator transcription factor [Pseudoalteromonas luteoviolacea]